MNTLSWLAQQESLISIRPREASRSPADADRGTDHTDVLALDRRHPGRRDGHRRLHLVAEAKLMGRLISTLRDGAGAGRAGRLHLLRRRRQCRRRDDDQGEGLRHRRLGRHRGGADRTQRGDARAREQGRRHVEARRAGRPPMPTPASCRRSPAAWPRSTSSGWWTKSRRPEAIRPRAGPHRRVVQGQGPDGGEAHPARRQDRRPAATSTPSCRTAARVPGVVVPRVDVQQEHVRAARQDDSEVDRAKVDGLEPRTGTTTLEFAKNGPDWRIVKPIAARADFGAVEGAIERLSSAQMQGIADDSAPSRSSTASTSRRRR